MTLAHPLDVVYFEIQKFSPFNFDVCMNIHPLPLKIVLNEEISEGAFTKANLFSVKSCKATYKKSEITANDVHLCYELFCPESKEILSIRFDFLDKMDPKFTLIGKFKEGTTEHIFKADQNNKNYSIEATESQKENFFIMGLEHIGASYRSWQNNAGKFQIADGIDHILFLVALLLVSLSWRSLLINVTGFTIGHSISLALSLSHLLILPALMIEPGIALSIAYLALRGTMNKREDSLWLTIGFGFLHGMGFSYVLQNLKLNGIYEFLRTLFMFNIGIEVGQLIILVLLSPLFIYVYKSNKYSKIVKVGLSFVILLLAGYWTIQRSLVLFSLLTQ